MFCAIMHFSMSLKCYESIKLTYSDYLTRGVGLVNVRKNVLLSIYFRGNLSPDTCCNHSFCSYRQQKWCS